MRAKGATAEGRPYRSSQRFHNNLLVDYKCLHIVLKKQQKINQRQNQQNDRDHEGQPFGPGRKVGAARPGRFRGLGVLSQYRQKSVVAFGVIQPFLFHCSRVNISEA